ncbi:MAG: hypothetical protein NTV88_01770 [Candidatus Micrarchaeota archaeon]|nr:hypothetical protein [Candidatus Micrarchaeota archaeon]
MAFLFQMHNGPGPMDLNISFKGKLTLPFFLRQMMDRDGKENVIVNGNLAEIGKNAISNMPSVPSLVFKLKEKFSSPEMLFQIFGAISSHNLTETQANDVIDGIIYFQGPGRTLEDAKIYQNAAPNEKKEMVKKTLKENYKGTLDDLHKEMWDLRKACSPKLVKMPGGKRDTAQAFVNSVAQTEEDLRKRDNLKRLKDNRNEPKNSG